MKGTAKLNITIGDTVVVQGAGPLGLYCISLVKEMGAKNIIAVDLVESRLKMAERFGADHLVNVKEYATVEERLARIRKLTNEKGADHVIEVSGSLDVIPEGIRIVRGGGSYLLIGTVVSGEASFSPLLFITKQVRMIGSLGYEPSHLYKSLEFLENKQDRYPFKQMITHRYEFADIMKGFEVMYKKEAIKAAIKVS